MNKKPDIPTIQELLQLAENEASNEQKANWGGNSFAKDAAEGVRMMDNPAELTGISERLNQKIGGKVVPSAKVVRFQRTQFIAVAASVALIAICVFMFNTSFDNKEVAMEESDASEQVIPIIESEEPTNRRKDDLPAGAPNYDYEAEKASKLDDRRANSTQLKINPLPRKKKRNATDMEDSAEEEIEEIIADKPVYVEEEMEDALAVEASKSAPVLKKEAYKSVSDEEKILLGEDIVKQMEKSKESDKKGRMRAEEDAVIEMESYQSRLLSEKQNKQYNQGISYFNTFQYDSAIQQFGIVLEDLPSSFEVNYQQAVAYLKKGRVSKAKKRFELASELASPANNQLDFSKLDKLLSEKKISEAKSYISQFQIVDSQLKKK